MVNDFLVGISQPQDTMCFHALFAEPCVKGEAGILTY